MMHYVLLVNKLDPTWKDETTLQSSAADDEASVRIMWYVLVSVSVIISHQMLGVY